MRKFFVLVAAFSVAGCAEVPTLPAPDYDAPGNREAYSAFKSAMKTDWLNRPFKKGDMPNQMTAMNHHKFYNENRRQLANRDAKRAYGALRRVRLGKCEWQAFTMNDVPKWAAHRIQETPGGAYACPFVAHYQINPPYGKKLAAKAKGRFYLNNNGRLAYVGRFSHPY